MLLWAGCRTIDIVLGGSGFGEGRLNLSGCDRPCRNVTQTLSSTAETKAQLPLPRGGKEDEEKKGWDINSLLMMKWHQEGWAKTKSERGAGSRAGTGSGLLPSRAALPQQQEHQAASSPVACSYEQPWFAAQ